MSENGFHAAKKPDNRFRQLSLSEPGVRRRFPMFLIMNFQTRSGAFEDCFNIIWKNLFMNGTYVPRNTTPLMPYAIFFFSFGTHMPTITPMANRQNFNSARVSQLLQQYSSAASNNFIRFFFLKLFSIVCFL